MTTGECTVYELRQYTLYPGTRDAFVRLFETHLLEPQDAAGMSVLGQFSDLDRADAFVWIRGFADMERRRDSLTAFYGGPVWAAHRDAANAMMIDSDDVLLLAPADAGRLLSEHVGPRPPLGAASAGSAEWEIAICPLRPEDAGSHLRHSFEKLSLLQQQSGGQPFPSLQSLHAPNTFPRLPVREDAHVAVTLTRYADPATAARRRAEPAYRAAADDIGASAAGPVHRLRLAPTPRSALR
jgi:NIPSNAP